MRATLLLSIAASALAETKSYAAAHAVHVAHSSAILSAPRRRAARPPLIAITTHRYKTWRSVPLVVREHIIFGKQLGNYLGSYVGPRALEPRLNEAIMNTMNSVNTCPYCTGLHGELGRMAGINSYAIVEGSAGMARTAKQVSSPAIAYTKAFAEGCGAGWRWSRRAPRGGDGRGQDEVGRGVLRYLQWGKTTGNTVTGGNALKPWTLYKVSLGELATFVYYTPLFIVVGVFNALLALPRVPQWFSAAIGFVLGRSSGCTSCRSPCSAPPSPSRRCRSPIFRAERVSDATPPRLLALSPSCRQRDPPQSFLPYR